MTREQITKFEYCSKHLLMIQEWKEKLPFSVKQYGCGTGRPNIEYTLEHTHNDMYSDVIAAISKAEYIVNNIIENI